MSAITNLQFSPVSSGMEGYKSENKGSKSKGSRPQTKKNLEPRNPNIPGTVLPKRYGPIPPPNKREPNIMYINPSNSVSGANDAGKSLDTLNIDAFHTISSWKNAEVYSKYAEIAKPRGSFDSSSGYNTVAYSGSKSLAVCHSSSSEGSNKKHAIYSSNTSSGVCSIS